MGLTNNFPLQLTPLVHNPLEVPFLPEGLEVVGDGEHGEEEPGQLSNENGSLCPLQEDEGETEGLKEGVERGRREVEEVEEVEGSFVTKGQPFGPPIQVEGERPKVLYNAKVRGVTAVRVVLHFPPAFFYLCKVYDPIYSLPWAGKNWEKVACDFPVYLKIVTY